MKLSRDMVATRDRANTLARFMDGAAARGIKVTMPLRELYNPATQKTETRVYLAARSVVDTRDPVNLEEWVSGDIRDTIRLIALQIGIRNPKLA